jgi:5-methylcytosine-specific restriction endonuclease McrA
MAVQQAVRARAQQCCEYCHTSEWVCAVRFTFDHILPRVHGGQDTIENVALACRRCNERRYTFTTGQDPVTRKEVALFHPVRDVWADHFAWTPDG